MRGLLQDAGFVGGEIVNRICPTSRAHRSSPCLRRACAPRPAGTLQLAFSRRQAVIAASSTSRVGSLPALRFELTAVGSPVFRSRARLLARANCGRTDRLLHGMDEREQARRRDHPMTAFHRALEQMRDRDRQSKSGKSVLLARAR